MEFRQFLTVQCVAFFLFGAGFLFAPTLLLESIYQVPDAGDVGWVRMLGASLIGVGAIELKALTDLHRFTPLMSTFAVAPALLTVALLWSMLSGTEVYNGFFAWSSLAVTVFFVAGHLWFARNTRESRSGSIYAGRRA